MQWNDDTSETETDTQSEYHSRGEKSFLRSESEDGSETYDFEDGNPLQLITFGKSSDGEDNLQLTLNSKILEEVLNTCGDRRICVISVVGAVRTGKSFLLNCIKAKLKSLENGDQPLRSGRGNKLTFKGFQFKAGYKAVTKGIWVWSRAFIVEGGDRDEVAVLLMDTEGVNDELSKPDEIAAILGISLLSSSILILNLSGELSLPLFNLLSKFVGKNKGKHSKLFQKISLLVHDWTRIVAHKHGERGGKKLLDKFGRNDDKIFTVMNAFEEVGCYLLPNIGEKPILPAFSGKSVDISKEFGKHIHKYLDCLLDGGKIFSKKILDNELTPQEFSHFFQDYVAFFNNPLNLECGINPDAINSVTRNTAGNIKVSRGLEEYRKLFNQRKKSISSGYFMGRTIDGLHVQARKRAYQSFKTFALASEEEQYFESKLDEQIKEEKMKIQEENLTARKMKIGKYVDRASSQLLHELEHRFPFTPEPGDEIPNNVVFYDENQLSECIMMAAKSIQYEFTEEFSGDEADDIAELEALLESELKPVEEEFTIKNQKNQKRATEKMETFVAKMMDHYHSAMKKNIKKLPEMNTGTLGVFHDSVVDIIEQKFETVQLATSFKAEWWVKLLKILDNEHVTLLCNLESAMAEAMTLVVKQEEKYQKMLSETANQIQDDKEIKRFHETTSNKILEDFKRKNTFPVGSEKYELVQDTLRNHLADVYKKLVEDGVMLKRKQKEHLGSALKVSFNSLREDLDNIRKTHGVMDTDECEKYVREVRAKYLNEYKNQIAELVDQLDKVTLGQEKETFETKINEYLSTWEAENREKRTKQQDSLDAVLKTSLRSFKGDLDHTRKKCGVMEKDECKTYLHQAKEKYLNEYEHQMYEIADKVDKATLKKEREKFETKINEFASTWEEENTEQVDAEIRNAENLVQTCADEYESNMQNPENFKTEEDFKSQHEKTKIKLIAKFRENCQMKSKTIANQYIKKLTTRLEEMSDEICTIINAKNKGDAVAVWEALKEVRNIYQLNMDGVFDNSNQGFIRPEKLKEFHEKFKEMALEKSNVGTRLNTNQMRSLGEKLDKLHVKYEERNDLGKNSHKPNDAAIGIDLGTTYCCVGIYQKGKVHIVRNSMGFNITPSYVGINPDGSPQIGDAAKRQFRNPENTIFDAKRIIGRRMDDEKLQNDMKFWPFCVVEDGGVAKIKVHGKLYLPEDISAMLLKHLKEEAEQFAGLKITKAVITVPAYFTDGQRQATIDAGRIAGLEVLAILNEPTAAALAYRLDWYTLGETKKILVYDLGGGTFDVAILQISDHKLDVLAIGGDSHLGGEDFDQTLMTYCTEQYKQKTDKKLGGKTEKKAGVDLLEGKDSPVKSTRDEVRRRIRRLKTYCEEAKKSLSTLRQLTTPTTVAVEEIVPGQDLEVDINRNIFNERNTGLFERTIEIIEDTLKSANLEKDDIDDVVLVGGSTRIVKLREMLKSYFGGMELNMHLHPDEAIAYGAAVQAAILNSKPGAKVFDFGSIQEITPMSLGVETNGGLMDVIIPKNTKIPFTHTEEYRTSSDGQQRISLRIYQGEENIAQKNKLLGTFVHDGIPPNKAQTEILDVTMKIDKNGILNVDAVCRSTKGKKSKHFNNR